MLLFIQIVNNYLLIFCYRHKRVKGEEHLPDDVKNSYTNLILNHVLYDTENCKTLQNFELVKRNTHCTFARTAILWGAQDYDTALTLEANVERYSFFSFHQYNNDYMYI